MENNTKNVVSKATNDVKKFDLKSFFKAHVAEFKRIIWPSKDELARETVTVIVVSLVVGLIIFLLDLGFDYAYNALVSLLA